MKKGGFTLAEVLITLTLIGVVAAITIPSVIVKTKKQEYITGYKKAISVLNSAIGVGISKDKMSPANTENSYELAQFFIRNMNVVKVGYSEGNISMLNKPNAAFAGTSGIGLVGSGGNVFYTADGFRYTIPDGQYGCSGDYTPILKLIGFINDYIGIIEEVYNRDTAPSEEEMKAYEEQMQGKMEGLEKLMTGSSVPLRPCIILVDVNGDKGPTNPDTPYLSNIEDPFEYDFSEISDVFPVLVMDRGAYPMPGIGGGTEALTGSKDPLDINEILRKIKEITENPPDWAQGDSSSGEPS